MSQITINNKSYNGKTIIVNNNKIIVDGMDVTPDSKNITISVNGDIKDLNVSSCDKIEVTGNVETVKTQSGDVSVSGNVNGSIQTMSGDVDCGSVGGHITTMSGSIKHKK